MLALPKVATSTNYSAGSDPWSGTPTKVAPDADYETHGWTPDRVIAATYENYTKAQIVSCLDELQTASIFRPTAQSTLAGTTGFLVWMPDTQLFAGVLSANPSASPGAFDRDIARGTTGGVTSDAQDGTTFVGYAQSIRQAYFFSRTAANQGTMLSLTDTAGRSPTYSTGLTASAHGGWLGMAMAGSVPVVLDSASAAVFGFGALGTPHVFSAGTWHSISAKTVGASDIFAFANNRTAYSTAGTPSWTEAAASWDGASGSPPASASMFRPTWDATLSRWMVGTADVSSSANAATTGRLWVSSDGIAWTTLVTTAGYVFALVRRHAGVLWGIARVVDTGSAPHAHDGLEIFVSKDDGLTWLRTGLLLTLASPGSTAATYRAKVEIMPAGNRVLFQSGLGSFTEYVVLPTGTTA